MRFVSSFLILIFITGCSINHPLKIQGLTEQKKVFVENKLQKDSYPGFMSAEGYIFSCRYGIHYMTEKEISPAKEKIFASLLSKYFPDVVNHKVTLHRFDMYYNWQVRALTVAGQAIGGALGGGIIADSVTGKANALQGGYAYEDLIVQINPEKAHLLDDQNYVGCKGAYEGEYLTGLVSGGHDAVVVWLNFNIDGKPYRFKTYYQTQLDESGGIPQAVEMALEKSFKAIATKFTISDSQIVFQAEPGGSESLSENTVNTVNTDDEVINSEVEDTIASQDHEGVIDVSGTYISDVSTSSIYVFKKPYRNMSLTFRQNGRDISVTSTSSDVKITASIEGDVISFTTESGMGCNCSYLEGEWRVDTDSGRMVGVWTKGGGTLGKWDLKKIN